MANFSFSIGTEFKINEAKKRITGLYGVDQVLIQCSETGVVELIKRQDLLNSFRAGDIYTIDGGAEGSNAGDKDWDRPLDDLDPSLQQEVKRRKHYIDFVYTKNAAFRSSELRTDIVAAAEIIDDAFPPSVSTLYRWVSRYRASNFSIRSLIPRTYLRGPQILRQSPRMIELIKDAFTESYLRTPSSTMKTIETNLAAKVWRENDSRPSGEKLQLPSRRTLYRVMERIEIYDRVRLKQGKAIADRKLRVVRKVEQPKEILQWVEMDHTPLDLFLIDEKTWLPLGRPTLTVALDGYSRMILGYYLSYGGTSAAAVLGALRHAILPKEQTTSIIPTLPVNNLWPCYGLMDGLVLDNGLEFHGTDLERVALDFGMYLHFCPTRVPQFKGRVERMLKTINYSFAHQLPGTSMARLEHRGDYDSQKHALLTLAEFKHVFEKWLLDDYAQTIHRGIRTTPIARWNEGVRRRQPELPSSLSLIRKRIGKSAERSLRHDGIWLFGIRYSDENLNTILRAHGRGVRVRVVYDPEDMQAVEVWSPTEDTSITVPAVEIEYARGLTLYQHQRLTEILRENGRSAENPMELMKARVTLAESIEEMMRSRKQAKRKVAAKLSGKTSSYPSREFSPHQENIRTQPNMPRSRREDLDPKAAYSVIRGVDRKPKGHG